MGAWGAGSFENDAAGDWLCDLTDSKDGWNLIRSTLTKIAEAASSAYLDASPCEEALAAAECVAIVLGKPPPKPSKRAVEWCDAHRAGVNPALASLAVKAARRIRAGSEVKELWDDAEDPEWEASVLDLEKRLGS